MIHIAYVDTVPIDLSLYKKLYAQADSERKQRADRYLRHADSVRCIAADGKALEGKWRSGGASVWARQQGDNTYTECRTVSGGVTVCRTLSGTYTVVSHAPRVRVRS